MSHDQLKQIALRGGMVQWTQSRRIETLFFNKKGVLIARHLMTGFCHPISPVDNYNCVEVKGNTLISMGDLLK